MWVAEDISERAERMRESIVAAYGVRAENLQSALRRSGRRLPRTVRRDAQKLVEAEQLRGHPKLLQRIDRRALDDAESSLQHHLKSVDRAADRRTAVLNWAALTGFHVLVVFGSVLVWATATGRL